MLGRGKRDAGGRSRAHSSQMTAAWTSIELGLGAIGVLLVVLGALLGAHWEQQVDTKFLEEMVLSPTSEGMSEWKSPSVPIISQMYFWNWTNAADITKAGYKPILEEVGPYTFMEKHDKVNMTWNVNGTVTYRLKKFYYFRPDLSAGNLTDNITSVNVIAATLSEMSRGWSSWARTPISLALVGNKQKISWTRTVSQLTFEGFVNPIQSFGSLFSSTTKDKFGYFYDFNGTTSTDVYTMSTGADDIFTLGDVQSFNYVNATSAHQGNCSQYRGSLGELWSPHLTPRSVLTMFTPDMCRPISYYYEGESSHNGIDTLVYSSQPLTVDNGTLLPENECFCNVAEGCSPSGLYDLRSCKFGAPVFMSLPHLYLADPIYHEAVIGMRPQPERHKFSLEMEPRTGVPLKVAARLQLNVRITKNPGLSLFRNVETVLLPVWWMETVVALPRSHTSRIQLLLDIIFFGPYVAGVIVAVGCLLLLFLICRRYNACRSVRDAKRRKVHDIEYEKSSFGLIARSEMSQLTESTDYPTLTTFKPKLYLTNTNCASHPEADSLMPPNNNDVGLLNNSSSPASDLKVYKAECPRTGQSADCNNDEGGEGFSAEEDLASTSAAPPMSGTSLASSLTSSRESNYDCRL